MWIEAIFKLYLSGYMEALSNITTDLSQTGSVLILNQKYFISHQQS
jgi:hypothetical protein